MASWSHVADKRQPSVLTHVDEYRLLEGCQERRLTAAIRFHSEEEKDRQPRGNAGQPWERT